MRNSNFILHCALTVSSANTTLCCVTLWHWVLQFCETDKTFSQVIHKNTQLLCSTYRSPTMNTCTCGRRLKTYLFERRRIPSAHGVSAIYKCHDLLTYLLTYLLAYLLTQFQRMLLASYLIYAKPFRHPFRGNPAPISMLVWVRFLLNWMFWKQRYRSTIPLRFIWSTCTGNWG